jgi:site-specific DNA recombinase
MRKSSPPSGPVKAVKYTRVSSKEQEKEGYSIPAQSKLLDEYAARMGFEVVREYSDAETAKKVGRTSFQAMLDNIRNGEAHVILVEKTDRLTRNLKDYVAVDDLINALGIEVHLVKEGEVLGPNAKSHTKLIHGIKVVLAKNYIDNLSEEIRKGQTQKALQGEYPHKPPYGYRQENKKIVLDELKAPLVRRVFELYASANFSFEMIPGQLQAEGFVYNKSVPKIPVSRVEHMLKSPFYRGEFVFGGKAYRGNHPQIASDEMLAQVDLILQARGHKKGDKQYLFKGLMTCARCGCAVVGEVQSGKDKKGRYVYYHCTNGKKTCKKVYVREEIVSEAVEAVLARVQPSDEEYDWMRMVLRSSSEEEQAYHHEIVDRLRQQIGLTERKIDTLYDHFLEGKVDESFHDRKRDQLMVRLRELNNTLNQHLHANHSYQERGLLILEIARNVSTFYKAQNDDTKREVLRIVLSNLTLDGKEVKPELHFAFASFIKIVEKKLKVEATGFEPATLCVQSRCSTN